MCIYAVEILYQMQNWTLKNHWKIDVKQREKKIPSLNGISIWSLVVLLPFTIEYFHCTWIVHYEMSLYLFRFLFSLMKIWIIKDGKLLRCINFLMICNKVSIFDQPNCGFKNWGLFLIFWTLLSEKFLIKVLNCSFLKFSHIFFIAA